MNKKITSPAVRKEVIAAKEKNNTQKSNKSKLLDAETIMLLAGVVALAVFITYNAITHGVRSI